MTLRLDQLPFRQVATVVSIEWSQLTDSDALRLRNLGLDEGVQVEALHGAPFGRDPLAIRIGRMTLAMRRVHAQVIAVVPLAAAMPAASLPDGAAASLAAE